MAEVGRRARHLGPDFHLVSISVDPERDTPARLAEYGARYGANPIAWSFLTGPVEAIQAAVVDGFKVGAGKERVAGADGGPDFWEIFHGENLVLVDRQLRIRGYFPATPDGHRQADGSRRTRRQRRLTLLGRACYHRGMMNRRLWLGIAIVAVVLGSRSRLPEGQGRTRRHPRRPPRRRRPPRPPRRCAGPRATATITGTVKLTGTPPEMQPTKRQGDPFCAKTPMKEEEVVVGPGGGLKNVVVRIN